MSNKEWLQLFNKAYNYLDFKALKQICKEDFEIVRKVMYDRINARRRDIMLTNKKSNQIDRELFQTAEKSFLHEDRYGSLIDRIFSEPSDTTGIKIGDKVMLDIPGHMYHDQEGTVMLTRSNGMAEVQITSTRPLRSRNQHTENTGIVRVQKRLLRKKHAG